ncbi:SH3 type 3 domain protein [Cellulophaga algicola DSM 14237]|uniref:SH3 type 3 domain protein n=1 Tax=Cellulophaga algicola (strain DSM 14237 / IC166 / ACAM 630) TaxID=688270 RepID=E6X9M1_CELAD|nr:SH3 domain-containing protein [Cellulophaga algicola]ADV48771.1 SH3 type 3 domain protein [Cellulophaga algicola DSM 14237]
MKNHYLLLVVLMLSAHAKLWPQQQAKESTIYTVAAKNGLSVRSEPSTSGEKIGKFPPGEYVVLLEDTGSYLSLVDNGVPVNGNWFKVKTMRNSWDTKPILTGYVFSGYLLKNESKPYNPSDALTTANTTLKFDSFDLSFYFYETETGSETSPIVKQDTVFVSEDVFNDLGDRLLYIEPKESTTSIALFYTFKESIWEYNFDATKSKEKYAWEGYGPYKELPLTRNMALFPKIAYEKVETSREVNLKLKDTLVHYPGEMGGTTATMSYQGRPLVHFIADALLKIVLHHSNGTTEIKYVNITLSYGC